MCNVGNKKDKAKTKDKRDSVSFEEIVNLDTLFMLVDAIHRGGHSYAVGQARVKMEQCTKLTRLHDLLFIGFSVKNLTYTVDLL